MLLWKIASPAPKHWVNGWGKELGIPVYLYENAASAEHRRNLASVRSGEYEGIADKIGKAEWETRFWPATFNEKVATPPSVPAISLLPITSTSIPPLPAVPTLLPLT